MPEYLYPYVVYLISLAVFGVAFREGDRPLKLAALLQFAGWTLTPIVHRGEKLILDYPVTTLDTLNALALVWISLRWRRIWCAVLAALGILIVIIPFARVFDRSIHLYNQYAANNIVSNFMLIVVVVATWQAVSARRRADEAAVRS